MRGRDVRFFRLNREIPALMDIITAFAKVCIMVSLTCMAGIVVGYPVAVWVGRKLGGFLTFLPAERFDKAPPALGIPAAMVMHGDLKGAVLEYEKLLLSHPREREIHARLLEIALGPLADEDYGAAVLNRALHALKDKSDHVWLRELASDIREGRYQPLAFLDSRHETAPAKQIVYDPDAPRLVKAKPQAGA